MFLILYLKKKKKRNKQLIDTPNIFEKNDSSTPPTSRVVFVPWTRTIADKKRYNLNIYSKATVFKNFIKITDSRIHLPY